nr:hypothetical transcript [Hymenolepis microstoma]
MDAGDVEGSVEYDSDAQIFNVSAEKVQKKIEVVAELLSLGLNLLQRVSDTIYIQVYAGAWRLLFLTGISNYSGAHFKWTKPNWEDYKVEHPVAVRHVKRLQELGLKDPWVSNYSGAHFKWTKPNWEDYKVEHPVAVRHVKRLQELGLKDPWVRNYVWVFSPRIYKTPWQICKSCFFNRLPHGFALAVVYTFAQTAFLKWYHEKGYGEPHAHF